MWVERLFKTPDLQARVVMVTHLNKVLLYTLVMRRLDTANTTTLTKLFGDPDFFDAI